MCRTQTNIHIGFYAVPLLYSFVSSATYFPDSLGFSAHTIIWSVDNESVGRSFPSLCLFFLSCAKTSSSMSRTGHESGQLAWLLVFGEDGWYFTTGRDAIWKVPYACPFSDSWNFDPSLTCESFKNKSHGCWILRLLFPHWFKQAYLFFFFLFYSVSMAN